MHNIINITMSTTKLINHFPLLHIVSLLIFFFLPNTLHSQIIENGNCKIKGMFVFGSSLVDNGNNNFLKCKAKADFFPYGIDFPKGVTGRWTNGKSVIDLLGDQLKLPNFIPPFYAPSTKGNAVVGGVNFASGGSGILDETGKISGNLTSMNMQIKNFEEVTLPELNVQLGPKAKESIPNYLFVIGAGGNDYTLNYFLPTKKIIVPLEAFTDNLITTLSHQIKKLYSLGARKFLITTVYPIGCSPGKLTSHLRQHVCVQYLNHAAQLFNSNLKSLVDQIKPQMPGSNLIILNTYNIVLDIVNNPAPKGFTDTTNPCCEAPSYLKGGNGVSCKKGGRICENRRGHVYFDGLHPTEAVNVVIATKAYSSTSKDEVYPFNLQQLAQI